MLNVHCLNMMSVQFAAIKLINTEGQGVENDVFHGYEYPSYLGYA